jgi:hypothetical protein
MKDDHDWNPSTAAIACIVAGFAWLILAALYQTCQSLAWLWSLVTGGAQ